MYRKQRDRLQIYQCQLADLVVGEKAYMKSNGCEIKVESIKANGKIVVWELAGLNSQRKTLSKSAEIYPQVDIKTWNRLYRRWLRRGKPDFRFTSLQSTDKAYKEAA